MESREQDRDWPANEARKSCLREKCKCDGFVEAEPLIFFLRFNRQNKALGGHAAYNGAGDGGQGRENGRGTQSRNWTRHGIGN